MILNTVMNAVDLVMIISSMKMENLNLLVKLVL